MHAPLRSFFSGRSGPPQFPVAKTTEVPIRILIEASQPDIRQMMASHLVSLGYECKVAETPDDALEATRSEDKFDLVCCDLAGWTDQKFWRLPRGKTHILTLIDVYDTALLEKLLDNCRFHVLLKPFTLELLSIVVRRALERHRLLMENLYLRNWVGLGSEMDIPRLAYKDHL